MSQNVSKLVILVKCIFYEKNVNMFFFFKDTTLVNYDESIQNISEQNVTTEHYADDTNKVDIEGLGNVYTETSDYMTTPCDTLTDVNDQYESYINDYSFDNTQNIDESQSENDVEKYNLDDTQKDSFVMPNMDDFQQNESSSNLDYQMTEEMLMSEREREKKSKKELEEEEREKMQ